MNIRVTIAGGGNLGLACAARMAAAGLDITLYTSSPGKWTGEVSVEDCNGQVYSGHLACVTADPRAASDCDLVFLCLPGNVIKDRLSTLAPWLRKGVPVASVFSADGFFFAAEEVLGANWPLLGFQRVPFISRTKQPYRVGGITGYRDELLLAYRNVENPSSWQQLFERSFGTPTRLLANFYEAALANSNPIIHPARLMSLAEQIERVGPFETPPLFYEEWDDTASTYAMRLDEELRRLASTLGVEMVPFVRYYDSEDAPSLTRKIRSIAAFKGIRAPVLPSGLIDLSSRYVQADIGISVRSLARLSRVKGLKTPCADEVLSKFVSGDPN